MEHRRLKGLIEEYSEGTLSPDLHQKVTQHLGQCHECEGHLRLIGLTQVITAASKGMAPPFPPLGFSRQVLQAIAQQRDNYLFWRPLRIVALRTIPVMAVLALILGVFAYMQMTALQNTASQSEMSQLESYLDLSTNWDQEDAVLSETISRDPDRVVKTHRGGETNQSDSEGKVK